MERGGACLYYIHCGVNTVGLVAVMCFNMLFRLSLRGRGWVKVIRYDLELDV